MTTNPSSATNAPVPPPGCPAHAPARDPHTTAGLVALSDITASPDPQAIYRRLRQQWGPVAPVELEPGVRAWLVMGYRELLDLTRTEYLFSRDARNWGDFQTGVVPPDSGLGPMMFWRANVIGADGMEHRRLRRPLDDGVAWIDQRTMRRAVERICTDLIAAFASRGSADLIAEYAQAIPLLAIADLFGLHGAEGHELLAALAALFGSGDDSQAGNRHFEEILADIRDERARTPADDMTTFFLDHADLTGGDEIMQSMVVMISAGQETTTIWIAKTIEKMLTDPRFASRLRGGRLGITDALDEVLWSDPPMTHMPARYAMADTELGGQTIRRGDALILGLAAANDDPRIHNGDPHARLGNRAHLAWSAGPHACPARDPARVIAHTAVQTVLERLPGIQLAADSAELTARPSPWTRCPTTLPVTFPPAPHS
ncbi:cytochrome P450 [Streptomyces sp. MP131-18]|uniref:cytochrome P450 n=1 Tax=Streptomyces sp. MP131-18 TaxID=1857892 RepID=UPI0009D0F176|nr:cytochrome P450 [Streptomyces sp. MP131-18]ONK13211.1 Cytochrome P450 107B1 [Streptomyces sp. MP131-18]